MQTISRANLIITAIAIVLIGVLLVTHTTIAPSQSGYVPASNITIGTSDITEANYTGTKPVITGTGTIVAEANEYIDQTIAAFGAKADTDVPDIRAKFGDVPPSHYEITVTASYVESPVTQSIIVETYAYTGGANGMDTYTVFTASRIDGTPAAIADVIPEGAQDTFVAFVKQRLLTWTNGTDTPVTMPDAVEALTIDSFANWAIDGDDFVIYFDKYQIGAGALGAVAFHIPLTDIHDYFSARE